jgi:hypothetical protein
LTTAAIAKVTERAKKEDWLNMSSYLPDFGTAKLLGCFILFAAV